MDANGSNAALLSASDLCRAHIKSEKSVNSGGTSRSTDVSSQPIFEENEPHRRAFSTSSSNCSSKRTSFTRKDSTAIGQTASLAAVALLLNTNKNSADAEMGHAGINMESERIRSYRNSVAYIDAEVETLLSRQRRGSKFPLR